ncbi:ABC transporter permease [Algoriphagus zhangzhouensis]|uniref:Putative ABC transport system permease protein n=1 Tax=Algoriphagus zhangzhouensis TaxID=1073327 RepID=A0A1M7ZC84_9BACT|nr:ABC transporter permease [Algoriphagus zhangzhouensis]TDY45519.1 putative ABC transport system permease protein [Algoriphagus zhangzhouensis]SHO62494.1 putative ABC transport system permease protein [Algoriphagus zhangzhouensis]
MFKNYLKIAYRNLVKNKIYTGINILGLTLGLTCCLLIFLQVKDEVSYDKFWADQKEIYRVGLERIYPDHINLYAIIPDGFAEVFKDEIPEVEDATRLFTFGDFASMVQVDEDFYEERLVAMADSNFFEMFPIPMVAGDAKTALYQTSAYVLNEKTALKYFGTIDVVGKQLKVNGQDVEVTGVMQDLPVNTHFNFDMLGSTAGLPFNQNPTYASFSAMTYIKLIPTASWEKVQNDIPSLVKKYAAGQIEQNTGVNYDDYIAAGNGYNYFLQPLGDIHLTSKLQNEMKANGDIRYVYIFISIAIFILLIASVNFINLATARSSERAREVGVRKAMGSDRQQLIIQFLMEAVLLVVISLALSSILVGLALPFFNDMAQKSLSIGMDEAIDLIPWLLGMGVFVSLVAGYYPAFQISKMHAVEIMKGKLSSTRKGQFLRNGLVVFQFTISIMLIAGTLIIQRQISFIQTKNLGFQRENVLVVDRFGQLENPETFRKEVLKIPGVLNAGGSSAMPGNSFFGVQFTPEGKSEVLTGKGFVADDFFLNAMGIKMTEGRMFGEEFNDSTSVILNHAAAQAFGLEDPIGKKIYSGANVNGEQVNIPYTVVGLAEDFHFESLHLPITPLAIFSTESAVGFQNFLALNISGDYPQQTIADVEKLWDSFGQNQPFSFSFLENNLQKQYVEEQVSSKILASFSVLAILIACIGLFGLAAYTAYKKTKEIGVRKVLGASTSGLVWMLTTNFSKLVLVAFVIAVPISYWAMDEWLQTFAYQTELNPLIFLLAGVLVMIIALLTVSYQAFSAARSNPVKSLKSE